MAQLIIKKLIYSKSLYIKVYLRLIFERDQTYENEKYGYN